MPKVILPIMATEAAAEIDGGDGVEVLRLCLCSLNALNR